MNLKCGDTIKIGKFKSIHLKSFHNNELTFKYIHPYNTNSEPNSKRITLNNSFNPPKQVRCKIVLTERTLVPFSNIRKKYKSY